MRQAARRIDPGLTVALTVLASGAIAGLLARSLAGDPLAQDLSRALLAPGAPGHPLGTDHLGRDVLSRVLFGARSSYLVALGSAALSALTGTVLGMIAGSDRSGRVDRALLVINDAVLSFPTVLTAVTMSLLFGPGRVQVMLTLGVVFTPVIFRVARLDAARTVVKEYFLVSQALGTRRRARAALHLAPNVVPGVLVQAASLAALAIGIEAALSFLGLGTQPPNPSWGLMLSDARRYLVQAPHLSMVPGLAAGLLAFAMQYTSDRLAARFTRSV